MRQEQSGHSETPNPISTMSPTYLLPCHGDSVVEVTTADAGRAIPCPCGKTVTVPTMREIRRLPQKEIAAVADGPQWSIAQGVLFAIGLVVLTASLGITAWWGYKLSLLETDEFIVPEDHLAAWDQQMMDLPAERTLDVWNQLLRHPLPEDRRPPDFEVHRSEAESLYLKMGIAGIVAVIGIALAALPILVPPGPGKV